MESIIPQIIANSIVAGALYFIIASGFNLIFSTAKFFDLGYGGFTAIGAYLLYTFVYVSNLPLWVSIIFAVLISGIISFLLEKICYRKLRQKKASNRVLLIASLGVVTVIQAILAMVFTSEFKILGSNSISEVIQISSAAITKVQIWTFAVAILLFIFLEFLLQKTLFGKAVLAINDSEEVSKIIGINTEKIIGKVFFLSGAIAALGGILAGLDVGIQPRMGFDLLLKGVIVFIIGGQGSTRGAFIGAFLLGFVENFGILYLSSEWKDAIAFGLLILFLLVRPKGIIKMA